MAKQLCRQFTSMIAQSKPGSGISECSPGRLICSSAKRFQFHEENRPDLAETNSEEKEKLQNENADRESENGEGGGEGGGASFNKKAREIGGPKGPEPTRYGDWEKGGRCSDF
ncbi:unnamed protein product [Cuscuta campestris]|uniref:Succinate dehydrogenase assembly factor 4, mitochondrial n=2 Tax=Cuscuta sect. Cleistogrammica TaxID=1824901 RepID=A0A484L8G0_9ASTE|nr:hypothetical protein DM860_010961 [Cuscuta australis]VFQ72662.1 unnamed protein product [Cuscuta campestris]